MNIHGLRLAISFCNHDSNVAVANGESTLLHLEAERVLRRKHAGATSDEMDFVVETALHHVGATIDDVESVSLSKLRNRYGRQSPVICGRTFEEFELTGHHRNHIGSANALGFDGGLVLCADGGSEDGETSLYDVDGQEVRLVANLDDTLVTGKSYGTATQMVLQPDVELAHNSDTGKLLGLSGYGNHDPELASLLTAHHAEINQIRDEVEELREAFGLDEPYGLPLPGPRARDFAATVQREWEQALLDVLVPYADPARDIVLSGGCAMNVVANARLAASGMFRRVLVPAAPSDAGQSLGDLWFSEPSVADPSPYLGRGFLEPGDEPSVSTLADDLVAGRVVALYVGRSESGPRALGNRSILALPSSTEVRVRVSEEIKRREPYRPVAPVIREQDLHRYFDAAATSPYMSFAFPALPVTEEQAPAIVHVDGTSRVQTLTEHSHPLLHATLTELEARGLPPILANTSMNVAGQPMVDTPEEAEEFFEITPVDVVFIGGRRLAR